MTGVQTCALPILPVGIVATGFVNEIRRRDFIVTWSMLSRMPLFEGFDVEVIGDVMNALKSQVVGAQAPIANAGHPPEAMYFIVSGEAEADHPEHGVRQLGPGDFFGEAELLHAKPHSANIRARTHAQLLVLTAEDFHTLLHKHAPLKERIERHAAARASGARQA